MSRKLYFSDASPFARAVRVILHELDVAFEGDQLNALRPTSEFASVNPGITIPVLEDGQLSLFESKVIIQYLLETYASPKTAESDPIPLLRVWNRPEHRWEDLKLLSILETLTETLVAVYLIDRSMGEVGMRSADLGYMQRHRARIGSLLSWLDERATDRGFVPGHFSIMDIQLISALGFADARDVFDWREHGKLEAIVSTFAGRPSINATTPARRN
jgi:glutathione S-transferase